MSGSVSTTQREFLSTSHIYLSRLLCHKETTPSCLFWSACHWNRISLIQRHSLNYKHKVEYQLKFTPYLPGTGVPLSLFYIYCFLMISSICRLVARAVFVMCNFICTVVMYSCDVYSMYVYDPFALKTHLNSASEEYNRMHQSIVCVGVFSLLCASTLLPFRRKPTLSLCFPLSTHSSVQPCTAEIQKQSPVPLY